MEYIPKLTPPPTTLADRLLAIPDGGRVWGSVSPSEEYGLSMDGPSKGGALSGSF